MTSTRYYLKAVFRSDAEASDALPRIKAFIDLGTKAHSYYHEHRFERRDSTQGQKVPDLVPRRETIQEMEELFPGLLRFIKSRYDFDHARRYVARVGLESLGSLNPPEQKSWEKGWRDTLKEGNIPDIANYLIDFNFYLEYNSIRLSGSTVILSAILQSATYTLEPIVVFSESLPGCMRVVWTIAPIYADEAQIENWVSARVRDVPNKRGWIGYTTDYVEPGIGESVLRRRDSH